MSRALRWPVVLGPALACAGCETGWQSVLDTHGPQADHIGRLMLDSTVVCTTVWVLVVALVGTLFRRRARLEAPDLPVEGSEKRSTLIVSALVGATVAIVAALTC